MNKKFISNLILLLVLNLLIKPFWVFGIDRTIQNLIGSTEFGLYFSLFSFSLIINIILDFGVTNFNNRSISQNPSKISIFFFNILTLKLILALVYIAVVFILAAAFGYEKLQVKILFLLVINQFLSSVILYLRSNISGLQFYTTDCFLSVLDRSIMIILCSLALWGNILGRTITIIDYIHIQTMSYLTTIIIILTILFKKAPKLEFKININTAFQLLKDCIPYAVLFFLMSVYNRIDSVMLERMLPDGKLQAGIYAQSFRILDAFSMFAILFPSLLLPMFARLLVSKESVVPLMRLSSRIIFVCAVSVAIACSVYSGPLIALLYRENVQFSSGVFSILIISFIPISISYIFGTLLTANGNLKLLNYISLGALIINCILNYLLIPGFQAIGSAWTCLITQSLVAIVQLVFCYRSTIFSFPKPEFLKYFIFILLLILSIVLVHIINVPWFFKLTGLSGLILFAGFLSQILSLKQCIMFVKQHGWDF
jgi:O-antigen/teichoic acid export membrane protein